MESKHTASKDEITESVLELLWQFYAEAHHTQDELVRKKERALEPIFQQLSLESEDMLFDLISELCFAYQRAAFLDGLRFRIRLQEELQ